MFFEIIQRQINEVKECGLKTVNEVRASNFLTGVPRISSYASANAFDHISTISKFLNIKMFCLHR